MGFAMSRSFPHQVTVHGTSHGQMIINTFGYRAADELGPNIGSDSSVFLSNFITMWRANILPIMYPSYAVYRYWLRSIIGVEAIPNTSPVQYKPEFGPIQDFIPGHVTSDLGSKALVGEYLPEFVAMTATRVHGFIGRRFWQSSIRLSPHSEADQGTVPNTFTQARINEVDTAFDAVAATNIEDGLGATNDWVHATLSSTYYGRVLLGVGSMRPATNVVVAYQINSLVSHQISRRVGANAGV